MVRRLFSSIMQEAYNFAMRCRVAQIVVFTAVCLLIFKPNVKAQNENCPPESASASDNKPSGPEVSISGVTPDSCTTISEFNCQAIGVGLS